ncbi:DUF7314 family protein [Haloarchaeobius amylolyticus]|uniref:DUF7314 family protein n=1 Tax=Haloarchaeobius amylolyticus TaxID=1198296 RepID=UPI0022709F9A|nr:hypothetical protein [Haloarchaeobius amylolyticus]
MADEFGKGLAIGTGAGLIWMVLAGWYNTPSFEGAQLTGPGPENPGAYDALGVMVKNGLFWFAVLGMLTFWVVIPAARELQGQLAE